MRTILWLILGVTLTASVSCSGNSAQSCDEILAADPAGEACPADGCPSVVCECEDGGVTSLSSCFNGVCEGTSACVSHCENKGGWVCEGANNGEPGGQGGAPVDCDGTECTAGQYCLISRSGGVNATSDCVDLPSGCTDCDCASDDAPEQFPTSNNCDSAVLCGSANGEITVTCEVPRSF